MREDPLAALFLPEWPRIVDTECSTCANGVSKRSGAGIKVSARQLEIPNVCPDFQIRWDGHEVKIWSTYRLFVIFSNDVHSNLEQQEGGLEYHFLLVGACMEGQGPKPACGWKFFPISTWVPVIKLKFSGLAAIGSVC